MFQTLTDNLAKIFDKIRDAGVLTDSDINSAMEDIKLILLEADVALPVVQGFISEVSKRAKGEEVIKSVSPAQMVVKIINDEMIRLLEPKENESKINLTSAPPVNLLIVGLQGSGKTTASAKLALKLKQEGKKVLLVSLDTYRPAAQEQLEILANSVKIDSLPIEKDQMPLDITNRAIITAKLSSYDVVIYDTAGRLHIAEEMIDEVVKVKGLINPSETFLVIDSMIGQDSINVATNFNDKLDITSIILSRVDGDSKGGAALSVRYITGKPIKFLSTGEKPDAFEEFDAKRVVSRILDKGDIISFVEEAAKSIDQDEAEKALSRLKKGLFNLNDYIYQVKTIKKMGDVTSLMNFLPGANKLSKKFLKTGDTEEKFGKQIAIVSSMTKKERKNPNLLNASRKKRVAEGAGSTIQEVNKLLKHYKQTSIMMKKMSKMDPKSLMRGGFGKFFS